SGGSDPITYQPRRGIDSSGSKLFNGYLEPLKDPDSLQEIRQRFVDTRANFSKRLDAGVAGGVRENDRLMPFFFKMEMHLFEGRAEEAYEVLKEARALAESDRNLAAKTRYSVIFLQGIAALRRGENENCLECRGQSACIFPLQSSAIHTK